MAHGRVVSVNRDAMRPGEGSEAAGGPVEAGRRRDAEASRAPRSPAASGYVARVELQSTSMVIDGRTTPLRAGMAVTTEVLTGHRTVLSYILSPISAYRQEAIRER
jgi:hemolysin D